MKKLALFLLFSISYITSSGQSSEVTNTLSFYSGISTLARQDLIFSPLIHKDVSVMDIRIAYNRQGATLFQSLSLSAAMFQVFADRPYEFTVNGKIETTPPHSFSMVGIDYRLGKRLIKNDKHLLLGGLSFMTDVQALNYAYGRIGSFGYHSTLGFGGFIMDTYTLSPKHTLSITLQLPLMVWKSRSPYLVNDDEFIENISSHSGTKTFLAFIGDGKIETLNRIQTLDFSIEYGYALNEKWKCGAWYHFEFIHSQLPKSLLSYRHSLGISAYLLF